MTPPAPGAALPGSARTSTVGPAALGGATSADWNAVNSVPWVEGAYGSGRQTGLIVGASYYDDGSAIEDGEVISVDALLTTDRFSLGGSIAYTINRVAQIKAEVREDWLRSTTPVGVNYNATVYMLSVRLQR